MSASNMAQNQVLEPILASLEAERRAARKRTVVIGYLALGLALFISAGVVWPLLGAEPVLLGLPLILAGVVYRLFYIRIFAAYQKLFKLQVMPSLVAQCAGEKEAMLKYLPDAGITENEFRNSGLFAMPTHYASKDLIHGKIGATQLRFSQVQARDQGVRGDDKRDPSEVSTIFQGLFFVADCNKHFQGMTYIKPRMAEPLDTNLQQLGSMIYGADYKQRTLSPGTHFSFSARELVQLENPEFERAFVVYATNQVEARYLLSPALMERLLKLRAQSHGPIHCAFVGGNVVVAIPQTFSGLENLSLNTPVTPEALQPCLRQIRFALDIVELLDLNTRIWSK